MLTRRTLPAVLTLLIIPATHAAQFTIEWNGAFDIPDIVEPPGVFVEIEVPDTVGMDAILDLDFSMNVVTTWQGDLTIALEHVDSGLFQTILSRPGSPEVSIFGFSADNYGDPVTGEHFFLDDEAANPYDVPFVSSPGIPNVVGVWQPDADPLSLFDGDTAPGTWRVWFADQGGGDLAQARSLALHFTTVPAPAAVFALLGCLTGPSRGRCRARSSAAATAG